MRSPTEPTEPITTAWTVSPELRGCVLARRLAVDSPPLWPPFDDAWPVPHVQSLAPGPDGIRPVDYVEVHALNGEPTSTQTPGRLLVSDRSGEVGVQGVDWPPGLAPLVSTQPLKGGFICNTIRGRLADGREVVVSAAPTRLRWRRTGWPPWPPPGPRCRPCSGPPATCSCWSVSAARRTGRASGGPSPICTALPGTVRLAPGQLPGPDRPAQRLGGRLAELLRRAPGPAPPGRPEGPRAAAPADRPVCDGPLPALLRPRPPASLTHGDLWSANVIEGRWLVDPAVSYADRELELAYMQLSNSLPGELWEAYLDELPPDPGYERRRPAAHREGPCQRFARNDASPTRCSITDLASPTPFACDDVKQHRDD